MIMVLALSQTRRNNFGQTRKEAAVNMILEITTLCNSGSADIVN
jgi:hypothetical protein